MIFRLFNTRERPFLLFLLIYIIDYGTALIERKLLSEKPLASFDL